MSAEHLHQSQQVFRALQDPQQHQFPHALTSSASPLPLPSAATAPLLQPVACIAALPATGSLTLQTSESEQRNAMSQTLRGTGSQGSWQRGFDGSSGSGFAVSRYPKGLARDTLWREEMWKNESAQRGADGGSIHQHGCCAGGHPSASSSSTQHALHNVQLQRPGNILGGMLLIQGKMLPKSAAQFLRFQFLNFILQICPLTALQWTVSPVKGLRCIFWTAWKTSCPKCG